MDPLSPEHTMADNRRITRHTSKNAEDEDNINSSTEEVNTHCGLLPCPEKLDQEVFSSLPKEKQMEKLMLVINQLYDKITEIDIALNHDTDGINTRITTATTATDNNQSEVTNLKTDFKKVKETMTTLVEENTILKGVVSRHNQQLKIMNDKVAMLTAKSMEKNIIISGITGDSNKEKCKESAVEFLRSVLEIDVEHSEIYVTHRIGKKIEGNDRQ